MKITIATLLGIALLGILSAGAQAGTITNGLYTVNVADDAYGFSNGSWNAVTASGHPTGSGNDLMYDGPDVDTNYSTLRVYGGAAPSDYQFDNGGTSGMSMDSMVTFEGSSPTYSNGWRTSWGITAESLNVVQDVFIVGNAFANSAIYHTVSITNAGSVEKAIGWRNLYDWAVNETSFDDGPSNQIDINGGGTSVTETTFEFSHTPGANEYVRISANPETPTYEVLLGLGFDPALAGLSTTAPEEYAYVNWSAAYSSDFDYTVNPGLDVTNDSAGLSWWGRSANSAITLGAGESVRFTQALFGVVPNTAPPNVVPVPGAAFMGLGLLGLLGIARRIRRRR
jgi:hypothetical protein